MDSYRTNSPDDVGPESVCGCQRGDSPCACTVEEYAADAAKFNAALDRLQAAARELWHSGWARSTTHAEAMARQGQRARAVMAMRSAEVQLHSVLGVSL